MRDWSGYTLQNTPKFDAVGLSGTVRVASVHDGDTLKAFVPIPWADVVRVITLRFAGIDAPELSTGEPGARSTRRVAELLCGRPVANVNQYLQQNAVLANVDIVGTDKYGRSLARITAASGECLNDVLLAEGLARPYS